MVPRETEETIREVGRVRDDHWERFDRLQCNLRPFLRGKPKRAQIGLGAKHRKMDERELIPTVYAGRLFRCSVPSSPDSQDSSESVLTALAPVL